MDMAETIFASGQAGAQVEYLKGIYLCAQRRQTRKSFCSNGMRRRIWQSGVLQAGT